MTAGGDEVAVLAVAVEDDVDASAWLARGALDDGVVVLVRPVRVAGLVTLDAAHAANIGRQTALASELYRGVLGVDRTDVALRGTVRA